MINKHIKKKNIKFAIKTLRRLQIEREKDCKALSDAIRKYIRNPENFK